MDGAIRCFGPVRFSRNAPRGRPSGGRRTGGGEPGSVLSTGSCLDLAMKRGRWTGPCGEFPTAAIRAPTRETGRVRADERRSRTSDDEARSRGSEALATKKIRVYELARAWRREPGRARPVRAPEDRRQEPLVEHRRSARGPRPAPRRLRGPAPRADRRGSAPEEGRTEEGRFQAPEPEPVPEPTTDRASPRRRPRGRTGSAWSVARPRRPSRKSPSRPRIAPCAPPGSSPISVRRHRPALAATPGGARPG